MKGKIIQTDTKEQIKETMKRLEELKERNRRLPLLFGMG